MLRLQEPVNDGLRSKKTRPYAVRIIAVILVAHSSVVSPLQRRRIQQVSYLKDSAVMRCRRALTSLLRPMSAWIMRTMPVRSSTIASA